MPRLSNRSSRVAGRKRWFARPWLEWLEPRTVPSVYTFDNPNFRFFSAGQIFSSTIDIPTQGIISHLSLSLSLDDPSAPNLAVTLIAPDNQTRVQLFSNLGQPGDTFQD